MTRDEAIEKVLDVSHTCNIRGPASSSVWIVDVLANLGLLKFDEPKPEENWVLRKYVQQKSYWVLKTCVLPIIGPGSPDGILEALDDAGLKIVEKD